MRRVVDAHQVIDRHVGVALRRRERRVAEDLLDRAQIGPAVEHVRRARVAERVRMQIGAARAERAVALHEHLHGAHGEPLPARREEERIGILVLASSDARARSERRDTGERIPGFSAERHDALFVSFADDARGHGAEIHVAAIERDRSLTRSPEP